MPRSNQIARTARACTPTKRQQEQTAIDIIRYLLTRLAEGCPGIIRRKV